MKIENRVSQLFTLATIIILLALSWPATAESITIEPGDKAPLFITETLEGGQFNLKEHLGRNIVLLNFWSVFCRDCISRIEALNKIADLYQKRKFELVGITGDQPSERMLAQVKKYAAKMHYDVILDPELNIFSSYGVEIIPFAVLVDRDGKVVMAIKSLDPEPIKAISEAIDRLTKE
jgi:peroxiredoxin